MLMIKIKYKFYIKKSGFEKSQEVKQIINVIINKAAAAAI